MAFTYPTPFRETACERMLAGERVEVLAHELKVSAGTLYRWKKQAAPVNLCETHFFANHCAEGASSPGSLIHETAGIAGGTGGLRTNRSG